MATTKITDLTAYTDPVNTDVLPIVDVTSDVTKKVSIANVMKNASLGSNSAPGIAFDGDPNTGIYSPAADQVAITTGGTARLTATTTALTSALAVDVPLGAAATPSLTFTGDLNTGIYSPGADQVAISTNGVARLTASTTAVSSTLAIDHPLGAVGTPSITFTGDLNTGFWSPTADTIAASTGGSERLRIDSNGRLGLGTGSPGTILDIRQTQTGSETKVSVFNTDNENTTTQTAIIGLSPDSRAAAIAGIEAIKENADFSTSAARDVALALNTTLNNAKKQAVYITSGGNVGIGTTSPATALHVIGDAASAEIRLGVTGNANRAFLNYTESGFLTTLDGDGPIRFSPNNTEAARLDLSGRLLVGTSTSISTSAGFTPSVQIAGTGALAASSIGRYVDSANGPAITFQKSRSGTIGSHTVLVSGDTVGVLSFEGSDGSSFQRCAQIQADIDGTPGATDMPGRLVFSTTADGASSPTERLRIASNGLSTFGSQAASGAALTITAPAKIYSGTGTYTDTATAASGTVAHGTVVALDNPAIAATNASVTYTRASTLYIDGAPTAGTNVTITNRNSLFVNGGNVVFGENVTIGGAAVPGSATASLSLINGTIPSASVVNGVSLYAEDVSASSELKVRDEAGNITTLSPHNFSLIPGGPSEEMAWAFYSERDGKKINVDMLKAIRLLEQLTGEQLVYLSESQ